MCTPVHHACPHSRPANCRGPAATWQSICVCVCVHEVIKRKKHIAMQICILYIYMCTCVCVYGILWHILYGMYLTYIWLMYVYIYIYNICIYIYIHIDKKRFMNGYEWIFPKYYLQIRQPKVCGTRRAWKPWTSHGSRFQVCVWWDSNMLVPNMDEHPNGRWDQTQYTSNVKWHVDINTSMYLCIQVISSNHVRIYGVICLHRLSTVV